MAQAAESAGWDALFVPDGIAIDYAGKSMPLFDPWVMLSAIAVKTQRIRFGPLIAAVPRRRPWKLARETGTLDHLSNGRLIFAAGLGAAPDDGGFSKVGEPIDLKIRAELMDECLAILDGLWSGRRFTFAGKHYNVDAMLMFPPCVQQPRIPTWVVGVWPKPKSMNRAVKWDGVIVQPYKGVPGQKADPKIIGDLRDYVAKHRTASAPFDIVTGGVTPTKNPDSVLPHVKSLADSGATWWLEEMWGVKGDDLLRRIQLGPPRI
jgi:alkanesulfonate monooxygenase SsuD/methylene tetrahydromethanopterin reductase-like flavin-dependent oxidoreductase (luciferase family)